jgi:dTDP-4-amino-4,6-dideoxygalactose transaminase
MASYEETARQAASKAIETKYGTTGIAGSIEHPEAELPVPATVPFAVPDIDDADIDAVVEVLRSGWITTGPRVRELEERFARLLGMKHAVAVNSATAALHLGLDAIGIQPGDEVIVPTITFTASAEVCRYFDAKPVLVDVLQDTLCLDPKSVEAAITSRTRAIMPVHMGGHPAEMDAIMDLAAAHGLAVIEDAAHAFPCTYRGRAAGTIGHLAAFSFYATKTITTAEGGMLVTNDDAYADRARVMALHGMDRDAWKRYARGGSWRYDVVAPGFKYNMTDIAAALGLSQLRKADAMWQRRAEIARRYSQALADCPELEIPTTQPEAVHSWHLYVLRLNLDQLTLDRDTFLRELDARGVMTSVHFIPVHTFTYYRSTYGWKDVDFPVACREFERYFSLPIYPVMRDHEVDQVIHAVIDVVTRFRR